jgi:hypothetical protein
MFPTKVVEKIKPRMLCLTTIFFFRKFYRLSDNGEKYGTAGQATDGNIIGRMRFAWRKTKATNTHSQYLTLIALPLQQWLHERASILRYTYIACLVILVTR